MMTACIATQAVTALSEILRIPHPGYLEHEAHDKDGSDLIHSQLGIKYMEQQEQTDPTRIAERLLSALREITNIEGLDFDKDGDIGLCHGNINIYVAVIGNLPLIRFYAPLVHDVRKTHKLLARLNELNSGGIGFMHFFVRERTIFAISEIAASPFQHSVLAQTMRMVSTIADGIDEVLSSELGGKALPLKHAKSTMIH
jgi:hypothetical protein